jgi:hypothetical protein
MSALISALDNYTPMRIGENGHNEYDWSNCVREKITQFSFQITRTNNDDTIRNLSDKLEEIIYDLNSADKNDIRLAYMSLLYKMIGQTRDIVAGKGECKLAYMMIYSWYETYPELAHFALKCFVDIEDEKAHPYGSWKDIKYFCEYGKNMGYDVRHPLMQHAIFLINSQLRKDHDKYTNDPTTNISLAAKWVPRETSKRFGWLYETMATNYFAEFIITPQTHPSKTKAVLKCKTHYRKLISLLNKHLDTVQIKQCHQTWSAINFDNVTSVTMTKQKRAFLNLTKNGSRRYESDDRIACATKFGAYVENKVTNNEEIKGARVSMVDFTKNALTILHAMHSGQHISGTEMDLLNSQWRDNQKQIGELGKMIAMVDVSGSMEGDPLYAAIALGIRLAEKSMLGKRVLTFSNSPTWVNLSSSNTFIDMVDQLKKSEWGMNTNFNSALSLILDAIIEAKMTPEDVQDMCLVIFSDMQIDQADHNYKSMYENIRMKYEAAGIRLHGRKFKPPHILFWNLRSTRGFPVLSSEPNTSMLSGFSPVLLNLFCEKGMDALQSLTPWALLERSLDNDRYKIMGDKIASFMNSSR